MIHPDVARIIDVFTDLGFDCSSVLIESENVKYGAAILSVGQSTVRFRVGKVTPKKEGLFVAVWSRGIRGLTEPLPVEDAADVLVVTAMNGSRCGIFGFPKEVLVERDIFSVNGIGGRRGFRVYPPWSITASSQAKKSQKWQCEYFLEVGDRSTSDAQRLKQLVLRNVHSTLGGTVF